MQVLIFEELALSYIDFSCKGFRFVICPSSPEILELFHNQISHFTFVHKVERRTFFFLIKEKPPLSF